MARRLWMVLVEDFDYMISGDRYRNQYIPNTDRSEDLVSVFMNKRDADDAAQQIASKHPGKDVHVFSQDYGFTAAPRPVESKIWTADGKFIPGSPS